MPPQQTYALRLMKTGDADLQQLHPADSRQRFEGELAE
jgi:hypothetical protein